MSINITSYDPVQLKQSLIDFLRTKPEFSDFNYEGSALLTIIDLLVRNTHYIAYMANMTATECFLDSAQLRANIVSHAQKLSYTPKSKTSSAMKVDLTVSPYDPATDSTIVCNAFSTFINSVNGTTYTFINLEDVTLSLGADGKYRAYGVELRQGAQASQKFLYNGKKVELQNKNIDTSTIKVYIKPSALSTVTTQYAWANDVTKTDKDSNVYYLSENSRGFYEIEFGKNILGNEPDLNSVIEVVYLVVEDEHANGLSSILAASPIGPYSNIQVDVKVPAYGGSDQASLESIRFMAPKLYQAQERAVTESDFSVLVRRDYPFIKSAIVWGGERNDPPHYGRVFMSLVPENGYNLADSVKEVISSHMRKYSLLVTEVVDVNYINCSLKIGVVYNQTKTAKTFDQLKSEIAVATRAYGSQIKEFDRWLNVTDLNAKLKSVDPSIVTVELEKQLFIKQPPVRYTGHKYQAKFLNKIEPYSVYVTGVQTNILSPSETIADDGKGNLVLTNHFGTSTVGKVNYDTGEVYLTVVQLSTSDIVVYATPELDNIYTERNYVVLIDGITVYRIGV